MTSIRRLAVALLTVYFAGFATTRRDSVSENKRIVLRSEKELWSNGNLSVADDLYSPDFVCHFVVGPEWRGIAGIKNEVRQHRLSFPDWNERVDDIIGERDKVVIRFTSTGTQRGEFAGIAPTGKTVSIRELAIFRLANGRIAEQWGMPDLHGLMEQLNVGRGAANHR
jgi:steroid delta-isomerase-like uncharacterized protein